MAVKKSRQARSVNNREKAPKARGNSLEGKDKPGDDFPVVGIGASAGGLEAIEKFFSTMPAKPGTAFVIVSHLEPKRRTLLPELVGKMTSMPVTTVENAMRVRPDEVYVIPPDRDIDITDGKLYLVSSEEEHGVRAPINHFFRSLANDMKDRAVGIVLSGMGADGAAGLREIKGQLGLTIAQDPSSAKFDSMPANAVKTGVTDMVLPPEQIPAALLDYAKSISRRKPLSHKESVDEKTLGELQKIIVRLRAATGHDLDGYKRNTLLRRIERRIAALRLDSIERYAEYVYETPNEVGLLFKEILIGVTSFFRDPEAFEAIERKVLPLLFKDRGPGDSLRIWVAGCSTGEEAFSLAILLREFMDKTKQEFNVQIFASDIDPEAIEAARTAVYPAAAATDIGTERLKRFFTKEGKAYRVRSDIRETIVFAVQDIVKDPPFTKLDLVTCRNLLIYLTTELQRRLLPLFHYSLRPKGILFLGSSETIGSFPHLFTPIDKKWKLFQRTESTMAARTIDFGFHPPLVTPEKAERKKFSETSLPQRIDRLLLDKYAPPAAVVTEQGDIVYIHGRTGEYLEPAQGRANLNIVEMAREGLRLQLPAVLRRAITQKTEIVSKGVRVKTNGSYRSIDVTVRPMRDPAESQALLIVLFEESKAAAGILRQPSKKDRCITGADKRIKGLEEELYHTKENLQSTIEELQSANEELKSANEEYQSTNEEMQSTNEELETSKEELQSLNEELVTVNSELQGKFEELSRANADMKVLLDSLQVPTIFLDNELRVKRFTSQAPRIVNLIEGDIGRPIGHIMTNLKYDKLVDDAERAVQTLRPMEREVETKDGRWYLMRIHPFKIPGNPAEGLVITFFSIDDLKQAGVRFNAIAEMHSFAESIIQTTREPLLVLDSHLRVVTANEAFYRLFSQSEKETVGRLFFELGERQWEIPRLRELLERVLPNRESVEDFEVTAEFPRAGKRVLRLNARKLRLPNAEQILVAMEDVTGKE